MNKQDIIRDLKAVCFDIIYSQIKEVLNDEISSIASERLQKTITSVDNLLSTLEDNDDIQNENVNLVKDETNYESSEVNAVETPSTYDTSISTIDDNDEIKVEISEETSSNNELIQDKVVDANNQNIEESSISEEVSVNDINNNQEENNETEIEENKTTIDYELEEYYRLTNNPVKAIIVNVNQLRKLRESLIIQKEKLDFGIIAVTPNKNVDIENKKPSIEELLEEARRLYKEGKLLESEKLYEQIRNMNQGA